MPPSAPSDVTLFYVEVGMLAELNTVDGYFTVQAALAPASHVLVPSCRLTGGFALVNWFAPNVHAGDFVFTVGGFHRAYTPPEWYPVPDRLGITFTLGDMINVTGNTYFAITPKCVMGGGYLHLGLDVGPVSAWLDVILDVFIQYKPFHYTADLSVSVGCAISIKIWFVHIRISISVGAALHIEGPDPFGGKADVNFYLFTFTIHFGGSIKPPDPIPLSDFYDMVQTPGPNDKTKNPPPTNAKLKFTLSSGLCPPATGPPPAADPQEFPNSGSTSTWRVKSGTFSFIVGFDFAISSAKLLQFENATDPTQNQYDALYALKSTDDPPKFYSKAMQLSDWITSEVTIAIYSYNATGEKRIWRGFTGNLTMKKVPVAVWGSYDGSTDPSRVRNPEVLKSSTDPTMLLAMGLEIQPPKSRPLPSAAQAFDATAAFREKIGVFPIPPNEPVQGKLLSAVAVANDTPTERWRKVKTEWKNSAELGRKILDDTVKTDGTKVDGLLSLAAKRLGWDNPPPSGVPAIERDGRKEWELSSKAPDNLIGGLDLLYAALPRYVSV